MRLDLRWPNDLDLGGRKAGGILCTSRVAGDEAHVGCGIGLNVRRPAAAALAAIEPPPAYLSDAAPRVAREDGPGRHPGRDGRAGRRARPAGRGRARLGGAGRPARAALPPAARRRRQPDRRAAPCGSTREGGLVLEVGGRERVVHLADARVVE